MECLGQLSQKHDYKTLSALAVLERYGVADIPVSAKQLIQESISRESLDWAIDRYGDHAESEFEKYCLVEFLEIASDRGIG